MKRRPLIVTVTALGSLAVLGLLLARRARLVDVPSAVSDPAPSAERSARPAARVPAAPPRAASAETENGATAAPAGPAALPLELDGNGPGRRYMEMYQGQSGRLPHAMAPEARYAPKKMTFSRLPLVIWADNDTLNPGERTALYVEADAPGVTILDAVAELTGPRGTRRLPMTADGQGRFKGELVAEPADYGLEGDQAIPPSGAKPISVDAAATVTYTEGGQQKQAKLSTLVFLQRSGARIVAGTQRIDRSDDGNAVLSFDIEVEVAGRYHAAAELWSGDKTRSIAFARKQLSTLPAGRHRISLLFGGAVIRDSQLDGPYAVRSLELNRVDTIPPHTAAPIAEVMETPGWRAAEFR